jgi:hypothetical protein
LRHLAGWERFGNVEHEHPVGMPERLHATIAGKVQVKLSARRFYRAQSVATDPIEHPRDVEIHVRLGKDDQGSVGTGIHPPHGPRRHVEGKPRECSVVSGSDNDRLRRRRTAKAEQNQ